MKDIFTEPDVPAELKLNTAIQIRDMLMRIHNGFFTKLCKLDRHLQRLGDEDCNTDIADTIAICRVSSELQERLDDLLITIGMFENTIVDLNKKKRGRDEQ